MEFKVGDWVEFPLELGSLGICFVTGQIKEEDNRRFYNCCRIESSAAPGRALWVYKSSLKIIPNHTPESTTMGTTKKPPTPSPASRPETQTYFVLKRGSDFLSQEFSTPEEAAQKAEEIAISTRTTVTIFQALTAIKPVVNVDAVRLE